MYEFEEYVLDLDKRELRSRDALMPVEPQVFDLIVYLVRNRDRVVGKDDLIEHVWGGRIVSESTLTSRISAARRALDDTARPYRLVRTVSRRGVRFVGNVTEREALNARLPTIGTLKVSSDIPRQLSEKPSIAVLPFANMSGDPEQAYFSDGITEDIITGISRLHWFFVIGRSSTFVYKGDGVDVSEVARNLGVQYVLEGSVRKSGDRVRVTCQLLEGAGGKHIWSDRYDRDLTDIFAVQDEIAASAAAAMEPRLLSAEALRSQGRSAQDLSAWELVARAMQHYRRMTRSESALATGLLRSAVERHSDYGPAHSMLAFVLLASSHAGWTTAAGEDRDRAAELARRAVELDNEDPWARLTLGCLAFIDRNTEEAVRECTRALELNPNFAAAHGYLGWALALDGQSDQAIDCLELSLRLSPHDPMKPLFHTGISVAHYLASRYDESIAWAREAVRERSGFVAGWRILCASLAQSGRTDEAQNVLARLGELQPDLSIDWIERHVPYTERTMPHFIEGMRKAGLK